MSLKRKYLGWRWLVAALLFAGSAGTIFSMLRAPTDREAITAERARRHAEVAVGRELAGTPDLGSLPQRLAAHGLALGAPVFVRIFKREFALELWMLRDGRFHLFETYPICRWSGWLGPKLVQGDKQAPEGFYTVDATALNPASRWHRSFNLGFPNAFDRAHGRSGSALMVHGGCSSAGCFAMTDAVVDEIWRLVAAALKGGQPRFHVHVLPFSMTDDNLSRYASSPWTAFWGELKAGSDAFEQTALPPRIRVCAGRYVATPSRTLAETGERVTESCPGTLTGVRTGQRKL